MPPDVVSRAFEPFFTTKEPGQGTGLGLSQVYGFVKQSGGHIKIYSEMDQGTTIKIYLPRYRSLLPEDIEAAEPDAPSHGEHGETILLVEDDQELRTYLTEVLRGLGYNVLSAGDAKTALSVLERDAVRVDLLLTDVVMPGINGRDLGRRALELRPGLRVLYMTGYSRNAVLHQGRLEAGVELLQKPVSQAVLAARVRDMLDRAQAPT
jgi:CheY-like chemotaxis protein